MKLALLLYSRDESCVVYDGTAMSILRSQRRWANARHLTGSLVAGAGAGLILWAALSGIAVFFGGRSL